jgi:hypothetical protein
MSGWAWWLPAVIPGTEIKGIAVQTILFAQAKSSQDTISTIKAGLDCIHIQPCGKHK